MPRLKSKTKIFEERDVSSILNISFNEIVAE
jgi:hypothetical protein